MTEPNLPQAGVWASCPRPEVFVAAVQMLAETSKLVQITEHAQERMEERGITPPMMFQVLRKGRLKGPIKEGKSTGDWVGKLVLKMNGNREAGVVTVVKRGSRLIIVTVEWEDMK